MRKFALAMVAMLSFVGISIAANVVFEKYDTDKKELTVTEGDKKVTYKITDKTVIKKGDTTLEGDERKKALETWGDEAKAKKMAGKAKWDITVEKETITEIKMPERKKKGN